MEWIRINDHKLKIMLSAEDAQRYDLCCEAADYASDGTRRAFREILTDIRTQTGLDATEDKVFMQLYPSKEGGCELFITRLTDKSEEGERTVQQPREPRVTKRPPGKKCTLAFRFADMQGLLASCRRLKVGAYIIEKSRAWRDEKGLDYLFLTATGAPAAVQSTFNFLLEYGTPINADATAILLGEHGQSLTDEAVRVLGAL